MAGHSKFKNIQHRKGAQDKKRAKIFGRLIKELTVAARGGTDAASNPRLRTALAAARAANMPKDNTSVGIYNTKEDLDKLNDSINNCKKVFNLK